MQLFNTNITRAPPVHPPEVRLQDGSTYADPWQPLTWFSISMIFKNVMFFIQYVTFRVGYFTQHNVTGSSQLVVCLGSVLSFIQ